MPTVKRLDKSLSTLIKDCDDAFRKYIQKRDDGKPCFICQQPIPKGEVEVCHYIKRANLATRWHEMNAHLGDVICNHFDEMHEVRYKQRLIEVYGIDNVVEMMNLGRSLMKPLRSDLIELIDIYKTKLSELK